MKIPTYLTSLKLCRIGRSCSWWQSSTQILSLHLTVSKPILSKSLFSGMSRSLFGCTPQHSKRLCVDKQIRCFAQVPLNLGIYGKYWCVELDDWHNWIRLQPHSQFVYCTKIEERDSTPVYKGNRTTSLKTLLTGMKVFNGPIRLVNVYRIIAWWESIMDQSDNTDIPLQFRTNLRHPSAWGGNFF